MMTPTIDVQDVLKLTFVQVVEVLKVHGEVPLPNKSVARKLVRVAKHHGTWCEVVVTETTVTVHLCGKCSRCDGQGFIEAYRHIHGGRCAKCDGSGNAPA